jgi:hypothetical protein
MNIFTETFWQGFPGAGGQVRYTPLNIDGVFQKVDKWTLLIVDQAQVEIWQGAFLMFGRAIPMHIIKDGRMVLFHETKTYDNFIYPYDPRQYPDLERTKEITVSSFL